MQTNLKGAIRSLTNAIDARDPYTAGHSFRVSQYALAIARKIGTFSWEDLSTLEIGALLHDIGKIGIPDSILRKPGKLTPEEYRTIQLHPIIGYEILRDIPQFVSALPIVRFHHERGDGSGYPDGLTALQIPPLVKMVSIADVFDALTSPRYYRGPLSPQEALKTLKAEVKRGWWDQTYFETFQDLFLSGELAFIFRLGRTPSTTLSQISDLSTPQAIT